MTLRALLLAGCAGAAACGAASASPRFCDRPLPLSAQQQDRLLGFAALVKDQLDASGQSVALVARSGTNLSRFGVRYSHAGVSLQASGNGPWSVRQLYYACDESRPRLYDQGMAGFLMGTDDVDTGYVSIVLLPRDAAAALERTALDNAIALRLLAASYSANAHPYSLKHQNCNQWVAELLATGWGGLADGDDLRARSQAWLRVQGYAPPPVPVGSHLLMFAAPFVPWVHVDDHPQDDLFALQFQVSMPAAIEAFVRERVPGAQRIELCHSGAQAVVHRGWDPVADGCRPREGDTVLALD